MGLYPCRRMQDTADTSGVIWKDGSVAWTVYTVTYLVIFAVMNKYSARWLKINQRKGHRNSAWT